MKILYLHQYFITNKRSGGTRSYEIIRHLSERGHEVHLITGFDVDDINPFKNVNIHSTETHYSNSMSYTRRIWAFVHFILASIRIGISIKDFDIVFATSTPLTIAIPAIIISRWRKRPFIFEVRDVWPDIPIGLGILKNRLLIILAQLTEHIVYGKARHIIALSVGMRDNILRKGVPRDKLSVVTNMSNIEMFQKADNIRDEIDRKYGTADKLLCIYAGTLGYANNVSYILDAAAEINSNEHNIHFLIAGDGRERETLINKRADEGIDNVTFIQSLSKDRIISYIKSSDICLSVFLNNTVLFDNSANKFFDYLAAGKPVIINYGGWQKDLLLKEKFGYVCRGDRPSDMSEKIIYISKNRNLINNMSAISSRIGNEMFSRDRNVRIIEKVLQSVLN